MCIAAALAALSAPLARGQAAVTGQWQNGPLLPFFPVHAHLMRTGKILMWPGDDGINGNDPRVLDPVTGSVSPLAKPGYDIFCSGHSFLPDGRLFVAGGHISNNVGLASSTIYDPLLDTWTQQQNMNLGRWYPTGQVLPNGDLLVVSGEVDLTAGEDVLPQVWQAATGSWRSLTGAQIGLGLYPTLSLAPNGKIFNSGPSLSTRYLDTAGTGAWSFVANHVFQGFRDYDGMVMYAPGKVLVAGGNDPPTNTAEVIDLNAPAPAWRAVSPMAYARRQMNATMLPDGKVLVTGGTGGPGFSNNDPSLATYAAEMWDPATERWTTMASATVPRLYHSIAMLLPDGRVMTTGGNGFDQTEIFSPPYLFAGSRPSITSAPSNILNGQTVLIGTPNAAQITSVSWVRLPSVTHTVSMSQAFYSSTAVVAKTGGVSITAPNDPTLPAGFYMLFLLSNGVPSTAVITHLGPLPATNPVPVAGTLSPANIANGSSPFVLTVNGASFTTDSSVQINGNTLPTTYVSSTQISAVVPAGYVANTGTLPVTVQTPAPGGGSSAALTFTVTQAITPNLTQTGSIIARVTAPTGSGSRNLEVIRDGDLPPVGSNDPRRQYDTYTGGGYAADDWIGYQYNAPQSFAKVLFQEGLNFTDGGWFNQVNVQVRQNGSWVNVTNLVSTPVYPPNDGISYETYMLTFDMIAGDAIRIEGPPGGTSSFISVGELQVFGPVPDITHTGSIISSVTHPTGGGNKNLEVIRDGDLPPVGTNDPARQFDTYSGGAYAADAWIGYQYTSPQTFAKVVFQEGMNFVDGGYFLNLNLQVRQNGTWTNVPNLTVTPAYPPNDGISYESYTLTFPPVTGDAIRIEGAPGGTASFISVGELQVFAAAGSGSGAPAPVPALTSISPASASNGDAPLRLTVTGTNFVQGSTVQWNGLGRPTTFVSPTQLIAAIPASDLAVAGTAKVTVATPDAAPSQVLVFTIKQAVTPNLTQTGSILISVPNPFGGGNKNPEVIRDGDLPPVGTKDPSRQFDTYHGGVYSAEDYVGYQYTTPQTFTKVVLQEGESFWDGGWYLHPTVQVLQGGTWVNVANLVSTPAYQPNDGQGFVTYTFTFTPTTGTAIRVDGAPGGQSYFISVAELQVFGQ